MTTNVDTFLAPKTIRTADATVIVAGQGHVKLTLVRERLAQLRVAPFLPYGWQWRLHWYDHGDMGTIYFENSLEAIETFDRWWNSFVTEGTALWAWPGEDE